METSQTSFRCTKGYEGEVTVARQLASLGFNVVHVGGAVKYTIDGTKCFCADLLPFGKLQTFWVQVKNKEPRKCYPDTGLETWRFEKLKELQRESGLPCLLIFTDKTGEVYGNWIDKLEEHGDHGNTWNSVDSEKMTYFWLEQLRPIQELLEAGPF